jgi:P pilus assembly protein, pilin FimA
MKKHVFALTLIAGLFASAANAADGTINFTGSITDAACTVDSNSASQNVNLGTVSSKVFGAVGATASPTNFTIKLTSCPSTVTGASVKFDGTSDTTNTQLLKLASASTAKGVGVAIYEKDASTLVPMHSQSSRQTIDSAQTTNTLAFVAKYMSTADAVTAGTANASTDFTIVYN